MRNWINIVESQGNVYYHVTTENRLKSIMKNGLVTGRKRRWKNNFGATLGSNNHVYILSDYLEAIRWAAKMRYYFKTEAKSPNIVILKLENIPGEIIQDPSIEGQISHRGTWFQTYSIPPECIVKTIPLTQEEINKLTVSEE